MLKLSTCTIHVQSYTRTVQYAPVHTSTVPKEETFFLLHAAAKRIYVQWGLFDFILIFYSSSWLHISLYSTSWYIYVVYIRLCSIRNRRNNLCICSKVESRPIMAWMLTMQLWVLPSFLYYIYSRCSWSDSGSGSSSHWLHSSGFLHLLSTSLSSCSGKCLDSMNIWMINTCIVLMPFLQQLFV